jgi:hypothetical protein
MFNRILTAVAMLVVAAAPLAAQAPARSDAAATPGWEAWLGCWRAGGETSLGDRYVCVLPGADAASVRMVTVEDGAIGDETVLRADGAARAVDEGGCTGQESAHWSRDGRRVFVRTELDCNGVHRVSTGTLAFVAENEWIDAQALTVAGRHAARSIRYRAVRPDDVPAVVAPLLPGDRALAREAARLRAAAPLQLEDVVEAAGLVAPPALEALIAARQHGFALDGRTLASLEVAGVPTSVLDVMIALSYPQRFAVEQPRSAAPASRGAQWPQYGLAVDCWDVGYLDLHYRPDCAYMFRYSRYGSYGARSGYSPWGYDPYGWRYNQPIVVIVRPEEPGTGSGSLSRGRGYTREGGTPTSGTARPRSEGSQAAPQPSRGAAGASNTGSTGSSAGSSSGSSSDTGRTARPRTGGGDPEQ